MINFLNISNFKSIKNLELLCKKVNVFIGEPNSGKSNIVEALSFFSNGLLIQNAFQKFFRFKTVGDLFRDFDTTHPIIVETNEITVEFSYDRTSRVSTEMFVGNYTFHLSSLNDSIIFSSGGDLMGYGGHLKNSLSFSSYFFEKQKSFQISFQDYLNPPIGDNLPSLLLNNSELRSLISGLFKEKGFRLLLNPQKRDDLQLAKEVNDELFSYSYYTISETLQRFVFFTLAIESNNNAILSFDEPDAYTFPFYTKEMAERIALDESNQFFITTHNPYLLSNVIEKTKLSDLNIFITKMENYETKVVPLSTDQIQEILDLGPDTFFNLTRIVEE